MKDGIFCNYAVRYVEEYGMAVFPVMEFDKKPKTKNGCKDATKNTDQIGTWGSQWPRANIGLATGPASGVWVLDIDGEEGEQWLADMEARHEALPVTPEVRTGKGRHLYFKLPDGVVIGNRAKIAEQVDIRGDGGYVIVPPSIHPTTKKPYVWHTERRLKIGCAYAPQWLLDIVVKKTRPEPAEPATAQQHRQRGNSKYVERAMSDELAKLSGMMEGGRNDQLNRSAFALAQLIGPDGLTEAQIRTGLIAACMTNGLWRDDGPEQCEKTISSGISDGLANPREIPEPRQRPAPTPAASPLPASENVARKDIKAVIEKHSVPAEKYYNSVDEAIADFNKEFAVIHEGSKVGILREIIDENDSRTLSVIPEKGFETLTANRTLLYQDGEKEKEVPISKLWMKAKNRRQYDGRDFRPNGNCPPNILNLWRGFSFTPDPAAGTFDIFLDHLRVNVCNGDDALLHWLLAWIADLFQKPHRKIGTAVVMRGGMGVGKGTVANHIGKLVSRHYMTTSQVSQITGKFNGHMADKLLMFIDEGFWAGDKSAEGPFKNIITEDTVTVEYKGKDAIKMKSYIRFIVASNNDWVVPAGADERRVAIFDVGDTCKNNFDYFRDMKAELENGGYQALLAYLLAYEYEEATIRVVPKTKGLLDQKMQSMSTDMKWWFGCLSDGKIGLSTEWPTSEIEKDEFYKAYLSWCDDMRIRHPTEKQWLAKNLVKQAGFPYVQSRDSSRRYTYKISKLELCRAAFETAIGQPIKWESSEPKQETINFNND
jgi:Bifunctional DNA primase/polymerase, N-terminal/Family of unknown function (DUF5906)